jgi:hypothetical protein
VTIATSLAQRVAALALSAAVVGSGLSILAATPARAVTHIDALFDCAAIAADSSHIPKFWAEADDTVTVTFRNCYSGSANDFYIYGGNGNGMHLNYTSLTNATNQGLADQWIVYNDATKTGDWTLSGIVMGTANGGSVTLGPSNLTIGYFQLPFSGGATAWRLGGVGATQTVSPETQTVTAVTNRAITPTTAFTPTNFTGTVVYSVAGTLPDGLSINSSTGVISGTPTSVLSATNFTVLAKVATATVATTVTISVNPPGPSISGGASNVVSTAGTAISPTTAFTVADFTCTPAFSVDPPLPAGLDLNGTTGVISGTPTSAVASADYTVTASCGSESATATVNVGVSSPAPSITGGPTSVAVRLGETMTPTAAFSFANFACTPSFTIAPDLPEGLALDATTGSISGSPSETVATTQFTVTASCDSETATAQFTLASEPANPIDDALSSASALVNTGLSTLGPIGLIALLVAMGLPVVLISARFRSVRELGTVVLHRSAHLTIVAPARFFDSLRGRSRN